MKTLFISISVVLTMTVTQAQQLVASVDVSKIESETSIHSNKKLNVNYLDAVNSDESFNAISELQNEVADYNIKSANVFDDSEPAIYDVTFRKGNNHLSVTYDNQGQVLSSNETYFNVPLPVDLRIKVSKRYPDWEFVETKCQISYGHIKGSHKTYDVILKKGKDKITLTDLEVL